MSSIHACAHLAQMSMNVAGNPCAATAAMVETHMRTALSLPSQPIPLVMNCSPHQESCSVKASNYGSGGDLEHELGR